MLRVSRLGFNGQAMPIGQGPEPFWENYTNPFVVRSLGDNVLLAGSLASEDSRYSVQLIYGSKVVSEAFLDLRPEPSPFWKCFWEEVGRNALGILVTGTIIVVTSALSGGGTGAAYVGLAISVGATLFHLIYGSYVNAEEIRHAYDMSLFFANLADFYGNLSYELSNYTPPQPQIPPVEGQKPVEFKPEGPIAKEFWDWSLAYRAASIKILVDTGLNMIVNVGITDFETAFDNNVAECERGRACGRIFGAALSLTGFVAACWMASELRPKIEGFRGKMFSLITTIRSWLTPAIYDLTEFVAKNGGRIAWAIRNPDEAFQIARLATLSVIGRIKGKTLAIWRRVGSELEDLLKDTSGTVPKISDELRKLGGDVVNLAKKVGQEELTELVSKLDEVGAENVGKLLGELNDVLSKSREACRAVVEWLTKLGEGDLKAVLDSGTVGKISELEESVLKDVWEAWRLNKDVDDFHKLLKGLSFTPDYPVQGKDFYDLLHECVESGNLDKVRFLERGYGWIAEVRTMPLEPDQRPAKIVEKAFPFIRDALHTLEGDHLRKVSDVLDNLLESRGKKGSYDEMLRLKRHLFIDIGLGKKEPKVWLVDECLEKWGEASRLSDAIVSHQMLDKNGHYTARSPVEVNYLDAGDGDVVPIIAAEDAEGGFGITIPRDAAEYLKLREEGFVVFREHRNGLNIIIPVEVEADGRVALTEWFSRVLRAVCSEEEALRKYLSDGKVDWDRVESDGLFFDFSYEKGGEHVEKSLLLRNPEGKSIRVRLGEEMENRMVVLTGIEVSSWEKTIPQAEAVFRDVGYDEEKARMLAEKYYEVAGLKDAEAELLDKQDLKGRYGEMKVVEEVGKVDPNMLEAVRDRYKVKNSYPELGLIGGKSRVEIDITLKRMLVSVKYWSEKTFRENLGTPSGLAEDLKRYRVAMVEKGKERVVLVFARDLSIGEDEFNMYINRLYEALGEGSRSWLDVMRIKDLSAYLERWR